MKPEIIAGRAGEFSAAEHAEFINLVSQGGEAGLGTLRRGGGELCGVAALKYPLISCRAEFPARTGVAVDDKAHGKNVEVFEALTQSALSKGGKDMARVFDVLRFRVMITPLLIELMFWAGIGGTLYGSLWLLRHDHWAWWVALVFGSLITRVICEFALLAFRSYDRLVEIAGALRSND